MQEQTNGEQSTPINTESLSFLSKILSSVNGSDIQNKEQSTAPADTSANDTDTQSTDKDKNSTPASPYGDLLSTLLSNPELLSKLPQMISLAKPLMSVFSQSTQQTDGTDKSVATVTPAPASAQHNAKQHLPDNRAALLHAMKPYLSQERREAIDYIVKLEKLGEILKSL